MTTESRADTIRRLAGSGLAPGAIAAAVGCRPGDVPRALGLSQRSMVVKLALEGLRPAEIVRRTGFPRATVHARLYEARQSGAAIPDYRAGKPKPPPDRRVRLPGDVVAAFARHDPEARDGGHELIRRVLAVIARDGLIDAVIDTKGRRT